MDPPSTSTRAERESWGGSDAGGVSSSVGAGNQAVFLQKVRESSEAIAAGDFRRAVALYTEAIALDPSNHILFTNRSAAHLKLGQLPQSLQDARKAKELNPKWAKAYLREGVALQQLGQHGEALAAFAAGLAQDSGNAHLLSGLLDAALKSPLKGKLEPTFQQLEKLRLSRSPFVLISVIGQELLAAGHFSASVVMLEAALQIGSCSLKLRGSVFSALSSAYWGLGNIDKALHHMQQDLAVAKSLGDQEGECRAYANLGSAYFTKGHYKEALCNHRYQLVIAMRLKDRQSASAALSSLGHVYTAIGDYPNALASHKQCVLLVKQSNDRLAEAREIGNVGAVYLAMGNFASAVECHHEHLKLAKALRNSVEEARAFSNLGSAYHYKRDYERAIMFHRQVLKIAEGRQDKTLESRAYAGLGHAARCSGDLGTAKAHHEKQLDNALHTRDKVAEGRACANLGIIFQQLGEHEAALKLHKVHLSIARNLGDKASMGRAYGNIGNAYSSMGKHELAVKYHTQELTIASEVNDRHSESSTHGNLAVAYQALGRFDSALQHYLSHLNISRELKDTASEARALCNLGNFHCSRGSYSEAISYYEQYLILSQELHDSEGESKACFNLGYAHFNLGNFEEAVRYYEQDLSIAKEKRDKLSSARAYCNLGLAHKALHNLSEALECQKKCLSLMNALKNTPGKFRALGNIGDLMLKTGDVEEAIKIYWQQYQLAKAGGAKSLLATACGALGAAFRSQGQFDKTLGNHTQELNLRQELNDHQGECRAHGNLGNVHMALGNFQNAYKCYSEQLERAREIGDSGLEAKACGNLGITRMNTGQCEEAIGLFEQQLAMLEQSYGSATLLDRGRAFGNLGDCYEALGDLEEAIKCHEQFLALAQQTGNLADQDRAYRGLGNAHRAIGNLQQALVCFEKRLVVAHELSSDPAKASAYGELGCLHSLLGNFEQAVSCLQHQLHIARAMGDRQCEGDAACGLGGVYQQMGEYETALDFHQLDLRIAEDTGNTACQCRAFGNLGLSHESLGNYQEAVKCQEQHLSIAAQMNDRVAKTLAYSSLGRVHHALGHHTQAVQYLGQGLTIAEQLGRREDEAKIRHRLGLALWGARQLEECQAQLYRAADLFELIRRESQCSSDYKLSLFDLQTACYQALQRVLVALGRPDEALVVAERACTRAFIDLLLERQAGSAGLFNGTTMDLSPVTLDHIRSTVARQPALVLCFSIAAGFLYCWLLTPAAGVVHFRELNLAELEEGGGEQADTQSLLSVSNLSLLDQCVGQVREALGIDSHLIATSSGHRSNIPRSGAGGELSETESEGDDVFQHHLEELGDRLNAENDRTGFLRMVNRSHPYNASSYSLGSLASLSPSLAGSLGGGGGGGGMGTGASLGGGASSCSQRSRASSVRRSVGAGSGLGGGAYSPLSRLYQLLIQPLEPALETAAAEGGGTQDLVLVLQGDLYLIPFLILRKDQTQPYLFERFNVIVVPSVSALGSGQKADASSGGRPPIDCSGALVVGNPRLTPSIAQHWHLNEIPGSEYEARIVGELLACRPLIGAEATKGTVLHQIEQVEVIHFAAHISWKLSSIVLSPGELAGSGSSPRFPRHHHAAPCSLDSSEDDSASDISCSLDGPALSEYLLTAADILNLKLHAKLVVLNSGYTDDRAGRINADGVIGLTRSLLSAGAQCVLLSLWPVPDQAAKLLMRSLYGGLQEGQRVTQALTTAIRAVQTTKQFAHPSNWGGWVLVGRDVRLNSKAALMGHAICQVLQAPAQCREALRVLLHLIEKSLQRLHQGEKKSMYTTIQSIENKVGAVRGWKDLLQAVGFRFEPANNGLPPAVFFPQSDLGERLTQASASLQALLGLPPSSVTALSKFITNIDVGEALIVVMREILSKLSARESGIEVRVHVQLWRAGGCHEFLASLGLDLVDVGQSHVTLRLSKQAVRRHLQFALQALVAVFDALETPRSLSLDTTSSSLESLSSSSQGSSSAHLSSRHGSTPPLSPHPRTSKSLFNPAEMEKMRHSARLQQQLPQGSGGAGGKREGGGGGGGGGGSCYRSGGPAQPADPSIYLSHQSRIRSLYGGPASSEAYHVPSPSPSLEGGDSDSAASPSPRGSLSPCPPLPPSSSSPSLSLSPSPRSSVAAPSGGSGAGKMEKLRQHFEQLGQQPMPGVAATTAVGRDGGNFSSEAGNSGSSNHRTAPGLVDVVVDSCGSGESGGSEGARRQQQQQQDGGSSATVSLHLNGVSSGGGDPPQDNSLPHHPRSMAALSRQSRVRKPLRPGNVDLDESLASEAEMEGEEQQRWGEGQQGEGQRGGGGGGSLLLTPQDLASRVLADVASQRQAVESMQQHSFLQSQESSRRARNHQQQQPPPHFAAGATNGTNGTANPLPSPASRPSPLSQPESLHGPSTTALTNGQPPPPPPQRSWQLNRSPVGPALTSPRAGNPPPYPGRPPVLPDRVPVSRERPPVPTKPSFAGGSRGGGGGGMALSSAGNMSGENSISSDNSEGADSNLQSSVSSGYHSEHLAGGRDVEEAEKQQQQQQRVERVTYTENFVNSTGPGGVGGGGGSVVVAAGSSFVSSTSSFRPYSLAPVQTNALTPRPESSNSTSSQYSTSSSARSVIYRPFGEGGQQGPGMRGHRQNPRTASTIPSILRQQSKGGGGGGGKEVAPSPPAKGVMLDSTKPLKKVSFSDSEDRESSHNNSFEDVTRVSSSPQQQQLQQQPLNYSIDSYCPPPPSGHLPPHRQQQGQQARGLGDREGAEYHSLTRGGFTQFSPPGEKPSSSVHIPMQDLSSHPHHSGGGGVGGGGGGSSYGHTKPGGLVPGARTLNSQPHPRTLYLEGEGKRSQVLQSSKC